MNANPAPVALVAAGGPLPLAVCGGCVSNLTVAGNAPAALVLFATSVARQESWCVPSPVRWNVVIEPASKSSDGPAVSMQKIRLTRPPDSGSTPRACRSAGATTCQPSSPVGFCANSIDGGVASTRHSTGQESAGSSGSSDRSVRVALRRPSGCAPSHTT